MDEEQVKTTKAITGDLQLDTELSRVQVVDMPADDDDHSQDETELALVGTVFAEQYQMMQVIGRGGMSVVYRAEDKYLKQEVAIKTLHRTLTYDQNSLRRFQQEAATALSLDHQNIVRVRNFGISTGLPYMAMDLLEGVAFSDLLKKNDTPLTITNILHVFSQTCAGLAHAHGKGIVHRDIKPSNIMLCVYDGDPFFVKVLDFGIAKLLPQDGEKISRLTQTGEIFGSPLYMCPEQWSGKPVDGRSDVYSLGCVLYEAVQGRPPFHDNNVFETMHQHLMEIPPPFSVPGLEPALCERLEKIAFRALEKNPEKRYQSMADFKREIDAVAKDLAAGRLGSSFSAGFGRTGRHLKRVASKMRALYVVAGLVALMVLSGVAAFFMLDIGWFLKDAPPVAAEMTWPVNPSLTALQDKLKNSKIQEDPEQVNKHMQELRLTMELIENQQGRYSQKMLENWTEYARIALAYARPGDYLEGKRNQLEIIRIRDRQSPDVATATLAYCEALLAVGNDASVTEAIARLQGLLPYAESCDYFKPEYAKLLLADALYGKTANIQAQIQKLTGALEKGATPPGEIGALISDQQRFSESAIKLYRSLANANIVNRKGKEIPHVGALMKAKIGDLLRWDWQNYDFVKGQSDSAATVLDSAQKCYVASLQDLRKDGDKEDAAKVAYLLAFLAQQRGDVNQARILYTGAVSQISDMLANRPGDQKLVLSDYSKVLWRSWDFTRAMQVRKDAQDKGS